MSDIEWYSGLEYPGGLPVRTNLVNGFTPFSLTANDMLLAVAIVANRHIAAIGVGAKQTLFYMV